MKSPLVEALRQANGNADAAENTVSEAADAHALARDADDSSEQAEDAAAVEFAESLEILPVDGGDPEPAGQEAEPVESLDLQLASNDELQTSSGEGGREIETAAVPALAATRASRAPSIGVYAPFICLAVALASGVLHFAYQWFGGRHENADLAVISARDSERPGMPEHDSLLAPPTRFKLVVDPATAQAEDRHAQRLRAGLTETGSTLP